MNAMDDDTLPLNTETVKATKLILHRTQFGTVWFNDHKGQRRTIDDPYLSNALFETAKNGSGKVTTTKVEAGDRTSNNLVDRGTFTFKAPM